MPKESGGEVQPAPALGHFSPGIEASASASYDALPTAPGLPTWPPLPREQIPEGLDSPEAFARWLTPQQLNYLGHISALGEQGTQAAALQALEMFEALPAADQSILFPLMLKPGILRLLGREQEAYEYCFEQLCTTRQERRWVESGGLVWEWLLSSPQEGTHERVIAALRQVCAQDEFVGPQLLLAQLLMQEGEPPSPELLALQEQALQAAKWRPYINLNEPQTSPIRPWLPQIAHSLYLLIEHLHHHAPEEAERYAIGLSAFPWELMQPHEASALESLFLSLLRLYLFKELRTLSDRLLRKHPPTGQLTFWSGYVAYQLGKKKASLESFGKAINMGGLERYHILNMLPILLAEHELPTSRTLLDQLDITSMPPTQALDLWKVEIEYCRLANDIDAGLGWCEKVIAHEPMHPPARFHQAVWLDERGEIEAAQAALSPLLEHPVEETRAFARLLLLGLAIKREQYTEANALLDDLLPRERAFDLFQEDEWRRTFLLNWGMLLEQSERPDEALALFEEALAYPPQEPIYGHILDFLCEQERFEEARTFGERAIQDCPDAPRLKFAMCQIEDFFGHWDRSLHYFEAVGFDWFSQEGHQLEGIYLKVRGLLGHQKPLQALQFCEDFLPEILADDTLRGLRQQVLKEVAAQLQSLEALLGAQDKQYQQLEETQRLLTKQREENRRRERAYQVILKKHEGLRESIGRVGQNAQPGFGQTLSPKTIPALPKAIVEALPEHLHKILQSAQHLWYSLAAHPTQDHSPVVLQLARVVEGQVNRLLLDPLCQWTLAQEQPLSALPRPSLSPLRPEQNRLSLGDAASLLYHQLTRQEADGSTSISANPRSSPAHAALLESFWQQDIWQGLDPAHLDYLRATLPGALRTLAKARNRAGHAHAPIERREAESLRKLVLGHDEAPGILPQLSALK